MPTPLKYTLGTLILVGGLLCFLEFGNPQWSRWIYVFQTHIHPGSRKIVPDAYAGHRMVVPDQYTGVWRAWNKYGQLMSYSEFVKGVCAGKHRSYHKNGAIRFDYDFDKRGKFSEGKTHYPSGKIRSHFTANGKSIERYETGEIKFTGKTKDGVIVGPYYEYEKSGALRKIHFRVSASDSWQVIYDPAKNIDRLSEFGVNKK